MPNSKFSVLAVAVLAVGLAACGINVKEKNKGSGDKDVTIQSPVGNLHVGQDVKGRDTGIAVYPGAKLVEKGDDGSSDRANVNISTPIFGLRLIVVKYATEDSPQKLIDFYANELKRYGKVVQCRNSEKGGDWHIGISSDDMSKHGSEISCKGDENGNTVELKTGTNSNAHIVAVTPKGKGAEFALVYVRAHSDDDSTI